MITEVRVLNLSNSLELPKYGTSQSAGCDVMACFDKEFDKEYEQYFSTFKVFNENNAVSENKVLKDRSFVLLPNHRALIPTGLRISLPFGKQAEVRPRSGLALKKGITVLNTPGTVDEDYTGEVGVILVNNTKEPFIINHGDRIAQLVIMDYKQASWITVSNEKSLGATNRGSNGFGSTGV